MTPDTDHLIDVPAGLKGVAVTDTTVGDVRGREGFYHYRQYSALDLAASRPLEHVWQLLLDGHLPATSTDAEDFAAETVTGRRLPPEVERVLPEIARASKGTPLDALRSALSLYGSARGYQPLWDLDGERRRADLLDLVAAAPVLAAGLYRLSRDLAPVPSDPALGHAANYLHMLTGVAPGEDAARALEQYLILTVDHGFNASTFTARVIASTGADAAAAVVGALGALSGPLHGGAPSRALDTLDAIGTAEGAEPYVRALLGRGERVMGFGHAVYRTFDPRAVMMREVAVRIGAPLAELAVEVEATTLRVLAEDRPDAPIYTNVEYHAGVVMDACGLPRELFSTTFALSRLIGWSANIAEQAEQRRLIRPSARYVGLPAPAPVPALTA